MNYDHDAHMHLLDAAGKTTACIEDNALSDPDPLDEWVTWLLAALAIVVAIVVVAGYWRF